MSPSERANHWLASAQDWIENLSTLDIALFLLAVMLVFWVWLALRAATVVGPVQVELLTHDEPEGSAPDVQGLTSLLRERLARSGLSPPPQVPAGAPNTDIISAIATSDIPQGAWVAKLLDAIPRPKPPSYELSATLLRAPVSPAKKAAWWRWPRPSQPQPPQPSQRPSVRFWLKPAPTGTAVLKTVEAGDYDEAVKVAAAEIFVAISNDAVHVFPPWARWSSAEANVAFVDGVMAQAEARRLEKRQEKAKLREARRCFITASTKEPTNVLPRLQLANLDERAALASPSPSVSPPPPKDPVALAKVLRTYLDIAMEYTELAEPRYRASVVCGILAREIPAASPAIRARVVDELRLGPQADLVTELEALAVRESGATRALLKSSYILVSRQRLRNRYELRGFARRQLLMTLRISRQCLILRRDPHGPTRTPEILLRRIAVRARCLWLGRVTCGWQAFYNAGCFYAMLAEREQRKESKKHLRKRAYRCLNHAYNEAGALLQPEWLADDDPDLQSLRDANEPAWRLLRQRVLIEELKVPGFPSSPWFYPEARKWLWYFLAGVAFVAVVVWSIVMTPEAAKGTRATALVAASILFCLLRADRASKEVRFDGVAEQSAAKRAAASAARTPRLRSVLWFLAAMLVFAAVLAWWAADPPQAAVGVNVTVLAGGLVLYCCARATRAIGQAETAARPSPPSPRAGRVGASAALPAARAATRTAAAG